MSQMMRLKVGTDSFECHWFVSFVSTCNPQYRCWQSVDVTVKNCSHSRSWTESMEKEVTAESLYTILADTTHGISFMHKLLSTAASASIGRGGAAKLIVPRARGYVVRSDIIPVRMVDCPHVLETISFLKPQQWFSGQNLMEDSSLSLPYIFQNAAGGMIVDTAAGRSDMVSDLNQLEIEVRNRLSFPWLLERRKLRQTLAFVGNYLRSPKHGGTGTDHYSTARALDINLIVLDSPDCWLADPQYAGMRRAFLPIDLTRDKGLPNRIVKAITLYGEVVDGIVTFHESLSASVAIAAQMLSLPTAPPEALEIATDKYKTSVAERRLAFQASGVDQAVEIANRPEIKYPLIVKPCRGGSSEGVSKADSACDVVRAVKAVESLVSRHGASFVIEAYCDGPEVDVNMVLLDGEVLFVEICDDFPKTGDASSGSGSTSFLELASLYPSKLPPLELHTLTSSVHRSLLRLGFQSGVFHVEARIKDSEMAYEVEDGILDINYRRFPSKAAKPSSWLIETNPRPPGRDSAAAVESTYGIDYVSLGLLFPLMDTNRIRALSQPFLNGSQYWCQVVFIPVERGGTFDSDNVCVELQHRRPDLACSISSSVCFFERGDLVPSPDSGITSWIASFKMFSRTGRTQLLDVAELVRQEIRYLVI